MTGRWREFLAGVALTTIVAGCVSVDTDAQSAREALKANRADKALVWSEGLATESHYSKNLGLVEAGRVRMLNGDFPAAERWFRQAIDSAVDRKEQSPKIKLGDVGNTVMAATLTDDRTRQYYLEPYEINLALTYGILAQLVNGRREDALADARLSAYIQDNLAETYGADVGKQKTGDARSEKLYQQQSAGMADVMAGTRNSWENPVLWWLTGVLFEADGETDLASQSYRRAKEIRSDNAVFAAAAQRTEGGRRLPEGGQSRLVVLYEEGLVPIRQSIKVPIPLYTVMSVDLPTYREKTPYAPQQVSVSGAQAMVAASPALDVRALAYRDLDERLPGVITRNVTRALTQAGAQAAVNAAGNDYAQLAVFLGNAVISAIRRSDTRSWISLPDGQQVWDEGAMKPGAYRIGVSAGGRTTTVPVTLGAGETWLLWIADSGTGFKTALARL